MLSNIFDFIERRPWLIPLFGLAIFLPFLGSVHLFDWDEINFAESAREMLVTQNYRQVTVNFEPFWEKPPLFFWLQAICMKLLGVGEWAARLPNALIGAVTLFTLFWVGQKIRDRRFGVIWALLYLGTLLPHMYFKSGIIDPVFNYFIFLSVLFQFPSFNQRAPWKNYAISGVFSGLAILTKGPVGLLIVLLARLGILIANRFTGWPSWKSVLAFATTAFLVSSLWFIPECLNSGFWFIQKFVAYQIDLLLNPVAGHGQPFYYHFVVLLVGCFPASVLALPQLLSKSKSEPFTQWMRMLFWTVLILFSLVTTKIIHYSSMCYMPLTFLAAEALGIVKSGMMLKVQRIIFLIIGVALSILFILLPVVLSHPDAFSYLFDKDPFAKANLFIDMHWSGWEWCTGLFFLAAVAVGFKAYLNQNGKILITSFALGLSLTFLGYSWVVLPNVERFAQGGHIDILTELKGKDVYVATVGFKSYATYFYFETPAGQRKESKDGHWLLHGKVDKPVYLVTKINNTYLDDFDHIEHIESHGGFKLYRRK